MTEDVQITLNETEVALATFVGRKRHQNARRRGTVDKQIGDQDPAFIDINGAAGEVAVCRALNCYPDLQIMRPDDGHDLIYRGLYCDAKTTHYEHGKLLVAPHKKPTSVVDVFILVTGSLPTYCIKGWMRAADVMVEERLQDLGHGPGYAAKAEELRKLSDLVWLADYGGGV